MPSLFLILKIVLSFVAGLAAAGPMSAVAAGLAERRRPSSATDQAVSGAAPSGATATTVIRVITGVVFAVLAARFDVLWQLAPYLALAAVLIVLSIVDAATHRLPNVIVWPSFTVGLVIVAASGLYAGFDPFAASLFGAVLFAVIIGAVHLIQPGGMGRGDVKLAALLGLAIGWTQTGLLEAAVLVIYALIACSILGLVHASRVGALGRPNQRVPFGPALATGSLLVIVAAPQLIP